MKRREDARHDVWVSGVDAYSGVLAVRDGDFGGVWIFGEAAAEGPGEIHFVVVLSVSGGGGRNRVGDVSIFAVSGTAKLDKVTSLMWRNREHPLAPREKSAHTRVRMEGWRQSGSAARKKKDLRESVIHS